MIVRSDTNTGSRGRTSFVLIGCEKEEEEVSKSDNKRTRMLKGAHMIVFVCVSKHLSQYL